MNKLKNNETRMIYGGNCACKCKPCPNCESEIYVGSQASAKTCEDRCDNIYMRFASCSGTGHLVDAKPNMPADRSKKYGRV